MSDLYRHIPNGGFPSIYMIEEPTVSTEDDRKKRRGYEAPKIKAVPIKDILAKRRHVVPFISLTPDESNVS